MRNINKILTIALMVSSLAYTSCIDEVTPTSAITEEQLGSSTKATEAMLWGMPSTYNVLQIATSNHFDWGYGAIMHIRDVMTEEYAVQYSGYDHFQSWETNQYLGPEYVTSGFVWTWLWKYIQTSNSLIASVDTTSANSTLLGYLGAGYAFRAHGYLDAAQMYEFVENDGTDSINASGNNVLGLTVPIVKEGITEEEARNNPRVSKEVMAEFIESDLNKAEEYITNFSRPDKTLPDISVVYGLKARLYMWTKEYAKAEKYARMAIDLGANTPMTETEWLDPTTGFNIFVSSWMWGVQLVKEDDLVQSGIINWTSWVSNEAQYGYAAAGPMSMINAATYSKINNNDFRKLAWKAPEGTPLYGKSEYIDQEWGESLPDYASLKFRPGSGDIENYDVGSVVAYPLMRIEEMYFIEAEAAAHQDAARGCELLNEFMQYRNPYYSFNSSDKDAVVDEIFFQKKVEFWGEGIMFFDYKRLNKPVTRRYTGTNFQADAQFNTTTVPAWMNFVIVRNEGNNNKAITDFNNPDPSNCYMAE